MHAVKSYSNASCESGGTPGGEHPCPTGQHMDTSGHCVADQQPPCPTGQHMDTSGHCVADQQHSCPSGQVMTHEGSCVTVQQTTCPGGQTMVHGVCTSSTTNDTSESHSTTNNSVTNTSVTTNTTSNNSVTNNSTTNTSTSTASPSSSGVQGAQHSSPKTSSVMKSPASATSPAVARRWLRELARLGNVARSRDVPRLDPGRPRRDGVERDAALHGPAPVAPGAPRARARRRGLRPGAGRPLPRLGEPIYVRSSAPNRRPSSAVIASRSRVASSSVSVRSADW